MPTIDQHDQPAFARGIAGPLGKLTEELKTKVDEATYQVFRQQCAMSGLDAATFLRDRVYEACYGKSWRSMVAEKLLHEDKCAAALRRLTGSFEAPEFGGEA